MSSFLHYDGLNFKFVKTKVDPCVPAYACPKCDIIKTDQQKIDNVEIPQKFRDCYCNTTSVFIGK